MRMRGGTPNARESMPVALPKLRGYGASIGLTEHSRGMSMCSEIIPDASGTMHYVPSMMQVGCKSVDHLLFPFPLQGCAHFQCSLAALAPEQQQVKCSLDGRRLCRKQEIIFFSPSQVLFGNDTFNAAGMCTTGLGPCNHGPPQLSLAVAPVPVGPFGARLTLYVEVHPFKRNVMCV